MTPRYRCIALMAAILCVAPTLGQNEVGISNSRSLLQTTNTTTATFSVTMPAACPLVTLSSAMTESCASACSISQSTLQVTQRSTLAVTFGGTLAITGGSNTGNLQSDPVPDLTLNTQPVTGAGWLTTDYAGFTYTPKAAKYAACNPTNKCKFDFYAIDPATVTGSRGKACRFSITVTIDPIAVPTVSSSQLYADYSAASMSTAKAPLALLGLLAVPALFLLGL